MKFAIGCDHTVVDQKNEVLQMLKAEGHEVIDCGTYDKTRTHYPIYGRCVALHVAKKEVDLGIVICGTGVGISCASNKVKGTRCVLVRDAYTAKRGREKYHANMVAMGGRVVGIGTILEIVKTFINAKPLPLNAHYQKIVGAIDAEIPNLNDDKHLFDTIIKNWEDGKYTENVKQDKIPLPKE